MVNGELLVKFRLGASATWTVPVTPLKLKASLTLPGSKPAPVCKTPLLPPMLSLGAPSPAHQLTRPEGGPKQRGMLFTVNTALELVADPFAPETVTE